jgi:hypothetical protein
MALSINEKVKVIEAKEKDKLSIREIIMRFKCGRTQVYNTLKQKYEITKLPSKSLAVKEEKSTGGQTAQAKTV